VRRWPVRDRRELIAKGFTMVDGLCAIQVLQRPFARRGLINGGGIATGRAYIPINTVILIIIIIIIFLHLRHSHAVPLWT
jgi:hypothetical protein